MTVCVYRKTHNPNITQDPQKDASESSLLLPVLTSALSSVILNTMAESTMFDAIGISHLPSSLQFVVIALVREV